MINYERVEAELHNLRKIEGLRAPIPCPDGLDGCLVLHFELKPRPIELAIRKELGLLVPKTQ